MRRVVITGMGIISPLGLDIETFWKNLLVGKSGIRHLQEDEFQSVPTPIGGQITDFDPRSFLGRREARRMSRATQFAMFAAPQAIEAAGLSDENPENIGVIIGSSIGGFQVSSPIYRSYIERGRFDPLIIPTSMNYSPSAQVSIRHGYQGPIMTVDAACATAVHSMGYAYNMIRTGMLDTIVSGGTDTPFSVEILVAWNALKALSKRIDTPETASRPFSKDRDGMVLGEGAGILILEAESVAKARGATILAEITGYGASADSHHITQPTQHGPALAMRRAVKDAGLTLTEIDYINAHATATDYNDSNETAAIKEVFGEHAYSIPVVGSKAQIGHSIGASGALEMIGCVLSLRDQVVPPTINYRQKDPDCDLDYVVEGKRNVNLRHIMNNSFAFGGSNGVMIVSKYEA